MIKVELVVGIYWIIVGLILIFICAYGAVKDR